MAVSTENYNIKLPQFEGPFDLLLFFIERDEIDIQNIPIFKITNDFLDYIKQHEQLNIELASEFILFASTLIRIKAKMLLPRKEKDEHGNEIDPRKELIDKLLEYKRFKQASEELKMLEAERMLQFKRGNVMKELQEIGEKMSEGTEIQSVTLYKLFQSYEKVLTRLQGRLEKPQHIVVKYKYSLESQRTYLLEWAEKEKKIAFENIFQKCEDRIHAIFNFLAMLELIQQKYLLILIGEGRNNFIIEWNENRENEELILNEPN
ncbi:MAG: segregation/condensation protein A [Chitinophagaceae bacterium]|nr:segregation/condensation protein A [Chitinophagaceae bacterium]HMN32464.1 segregation/condensation protein A [Chitinophagaceae bacterium]